MSLTMVRRRAGRVDASLAATYASAMHAVRILGDELAAAQAVGVDIAERRRLHHRIDQELVRAIQAADSVYHELFEAAGGRHHADADPEVELWNRRLNTALTVRSQHELAEFDDAGAIAPAVAHPPTRAASGPHQAGLDFEVEQADGSYRLPFMIG